MLPPPIPTFQLVERRRSTDDQSAPTATLHTTTTTSQRRFVAFSPQKQFARNLRPAASVREYVAYFTFFPDFKKHNFLRFYRAMLAQSAVMRQ